MFIGLNFFGSQDNLVYETNNRLTDIYRLELTNIIVDEMEIRTDTSIPFSTDKSEWDYDFIAKAEFKGNLEAGNIDNGGIPVEKIVFKKRKSIDLIWQTVCTMTFDTLIKYYTYIDRMVQATEEYEYAIIPVTANVEGEYTVASIECSFDGSWICDRDTGYKLFYNLEYGDIDHVLPSTVVETFYQYPTIVNGIQDYAKGNVKAVIMTDDDIENGTITPRDERILRENLIKFIKNRKPKILKDSSGRYFIVSTLNPNFQPMNANFGILPPFEEKIRDKKLKYEKMAARSLEDVDKLL
jgi:hypothetical protein